MVKFRNWVVVFAVALLAFGLTPAAAVAQVIDGSLHNSEHPGSVVVFPKFHTGLIGNGLARTTFELGVVCPPEARTGSGGCRFPQGYDVKIKLHWICPAAVQKGAAGFCQSQDFELHTTVNGKVEFDAAGRVTVGPFDLNGGRIPIPNCPEGYLIAFVIDEFGNPISFNGLIGEEVLRLRPGSASAYNGITFQSPRPVTTPTDVNGNFALDFDGVEYLRAATQIAADVRYEKLTAPTISTFLTVLTLDIRQNNNNPNVVIPVNFYRANEVPVSDSLHFTCWRQIRLTDINPNLSAGRMGTKGLVASTGPAVIASQCTGPGCLPAGTPVTILGIVTTLEDNPGAQREYGYAMYSVGPGFNTTFDPQP